MQTWEIPQELIDILDKEAGRKHSREGTVLMTLARILTRYDQLKSCPECTEFMATAAEGFSCSTCGMRGWKA